MDHFIRRLIDSMGLKICDEGGLNGFLPFFTCRPEKPYQELIDDINQNEKAKCPFVRKECPAGGLPAECNGVYNPTWETHRRRDCAGKGK